MNNLTWPTTAFLVVFVACVTFLVYKMMIPSHTLVGFGSAVVGYIVGKRSEKTSEKG